MRRPPLPAGVPHQELEEALERTKAQLKEQKEEQLVAVEVQPPPAPEPSAPVPAPTLPLCPAT